MSLLCCCFYILFFPFWGTNMTTINTHTHTVKCTIAYINCSESDKKTANRANSNSFDIFILHEIIFETLLIVFVMEMVELALFAIVYVFFCLFFFILLHFDIMLIFTFVWCWHGGECVSDCVTSPINKMRKNNT